MGLDMFLTRKVDISDYYIKFEPKENQPALEIKNPVYVTEDFGYWRKANHIHNWFVFNVQNNNDDCAKYYVSKEDFQCLIDICQKVLDNHAAASKLLPTVGGFFFGSQEYDEYYFESVKYTLDICQKALELVDQAPYSKFYYQSSW